MSALPEFTLELCHLMQDYDVSTEELEIVVSVIEEQERIAQESLEMLENMSGK